MGPLKLEGPRNLTDADVANIVNALNDSKHTECRFGDIEVDDLKEAVQFYKNFNKLMADSGSTIWKTVLVLGVGGVCSLLLLGFWTKVRGPG